MTSGQPGLGERISAFIREHSISVSRDIDQYLAENMYGLVDKHKLATKNELAEIDKSLSGYESRLDDLETWKRDTQRRTDGISHRLDLLEKKYSVK